MLHSIPGIFSDVCAFIFKGSCHGNELNLCNNQLFEYRFSLPLFMYFQLHIWSLKELVL